MEDQNNLILTKDDFQKLSSLIHAENSKTAELLEEELGRTSIVADDDLPKDIVSMISKVCSKSI